jgi:tRNA A-37 threonylcarbamoyl transferase component Bud32
MSGEDEIPPGEPRTVFNPAASARGATSIASAPPQTGFAPSGAGRVEVGSVLNNMFEVKRLIGRGGMAEVFEGVNINDDHDRVAIKVMLPQLAADPNVQAMFRKEARTLTRISHPAVVQYRVLAQEPSLGVFYIVTEFIDGEPLSDALGRIQPTSAQLRALTRRLAEGLRAAHLLGAVHRDISPDNVLLPGKVLDQAKVIDFGIAKDLDPSKATIVGDGFAGKLGFVAPEQFGDFGREIGPWTDVYSLGLVILAVAAGRNVDMGATLVDAIDRRRAGPDLSVAPEDLRPVLARMLAPNPTDRLKSMDEVLALLDETAGGSAPRPVSAPQPVAAKPPSPPPPKAAAAPAGRNTLLPIVGGAVVLLAALGAGAFFLMKPAPKATPVADSGASPASAGAGAAGPEAARRSIEASLASVPCSWLDLVSVTPSGGGAAVTLTGVAGSTQGASAAVISAARKSGVSVPDVNLADVLPVDPQVCAALDALRPYRADTSAAGRKLSTSQTKYTFEKTPSGLSQTAVITMALGQPLPNFAFFGLDPTGTFTPLVGDKTQFEADLKDPRYKTVFADEGGGAYRVSIGMDPPAGLQGVLLLTGNGPFDPKLIATPPASRGPDWGRQVAEAAQKGGWKAEMVWYRTVNPVGG